MWLHGWRQQGSQAVRPKPSVEPVYRLRVPTSQSLRYHIATFLPFPHWIGLTLQKHKVNNTSGSFCPRAWPAPSLGLPSLLEREPGGH